jgi:hypothetical protein
MGWVDSASRHFAAGCPSLFAEVGNRRRGKALSLVVKLPHHHDSLPDRAQVDYMSELSIDCHEYGRPFAGGYNCSNALFTRTLYRLLLHLFATMSTTNRWVRIMPR